jgi:hypothetical protein
MPAGAKDNVPATQGTTTMYQITSNNYFEVSRVELKNVRKYFSSIFQEKAFVFLYSVLIHYSPNQFLKPNKLIQTHRNYSKVNK